MEMQKI